MIHSVRAIEGFRVSQLDFALKLWFDTLKGQILPGPAHLELRDFESAPQHTRYLQECQC